MFVPIILRLHVCLIFSCQSVHEKYGCFDPLRCDHHLVTYQRNGEIDFVLFVVNVANIFYKGKFENTFWTHSGRQHSFACSVCDKGFICRGNLKQHIKTHSAEYQQICREIGNVRYICVWMSAVCKILLFKVQKSLFKSQFIPSVTKLFHSVWSNYIIVPSNQIQPLKLRYKI